MDEAVESAAIHEALTLVLFSVGGWRIGVEARQVRGSRPAPSGSAVRELAALLGLPVLAGSPLGRQCLALKRSEQDKEEDKEVLVDAPVDLVSLPVAAIHPLPPLLAARIQLRGLRALGIQPDAGETALTLLFDADTF